MRYHKHLVLKPPGQPGTYDIVCFSYFLLKALLDKA
jgi:hypothetical protein